MSWGTYFTAEMYINRRHFDSVEEVRHAISEQNKILEHLWEEVLALMAATPMSLYDPESDDGDAITAVLLKYRELKEQIEAEGYELFMLGHLVDNFNSSEKD